MSWQTFLKNDHQVESEIWNPYSNKKKYDTFTFQLCELSLTLYYDGNSETTCFVGTLFGNSVGERHTFLWWIKYAMFPSVPTEGFPRESILMCGSKVVLTSLIIEYSIWKLRLLNTSILQDLDES